jgi:hypothetical protein
MVDGTFGSERPIEKVINRLRTMGKKPRISHGFKGTALCPAHEDRNASFSFDEGVDGKALVRCYVRCDFKAICDALQLAPSELFPMNDRPLGGYSNYVPKKMPGVNPVPPPKKPHEHWQALADSYAKNLTPEYRHELMQLLGLPEEVLDVLADVGVNEEGHTTFPERDADDQIIGILKRTLQGQKKTMKDSNRGLHIPKTWRTMEGPVFIVEGPTDVLAMLAAGLRCIGRPSNNGGAAHLIELLKELPADTPIVIVGENDKKENDLWPGKEGAIAVANSLAEALHREIAWALPPDGLKDCRVVLTAPSQEGVAWPERGKRLSDHFLQRKHPIPPGGHQGEGPHRVSFSNFYVEEGTDSSGNRTTRNVGYPVTHLIDQLHGFGHGFPKRVSKQLFCREGDDPIYLSSPVELSAWMGRTLSRQLPGIQSNPIIWGRARDMVSMGELYSALQQQAEAFEAVEQYPHEPQLPHHYYCHRPLTAPEHGALFHLLGRFAPASELDADLLLAFFLTLVCGVAPGHRPGFLITANEGDEHQGRGVGKTTLVRLAALLVGGYIEFGSNECDQQFRTRLLSPTARGKRVILIDNIKSYRLSMASLEAMITSSVISGKQNYVGEGQLPNTFIWCLTINGACLSKDLAQRCVIMNLHRPHYQGNWEEETAQFIEEHRWEILASLISILKSPASPLAQNSRWGKWENLVLARVGQPDICQQLIKDRQDAIDADEEDKEIVRQAIVQAISDAGHDPDETRVFITSSRLAFIVSEATGDKLATNKVSGHLASLGIPELRKSNRGSERGWCWQGRHAKADSVTVHLR